MPCVTPRPTGHNARNALGILGVTVGSGHTMVVLYEYINYSFPCSRRITTLGARVVWLREAATQSDGVFITPAVRPAVAGALSVPVQTYTQ